MAASKQQTWLSDADQSRITAAIAAAERVSTGEVRVYIESKCPEPEALDRAKKLFLEVGMDKTIRRNGVLIYLAVDDHVFAIIGDAGIDEKAGGTTYWNAAATELAGFLKQGRQTDGLVRCIEDIGALLAVHFPPDGNDTGDEISNEILFGQ